MNTIISRSGALFCFCKEEIEGSELIDRFYDYTF